MRTNAGIGIALLAAVTLAAPAAFAQKAARSASTVFLQKDASYLGIGVADVDTERAKALKMNEERGAEITSVAPDGPAAKAGIKDNDVVLEYNGTPVQSTEQLQRLVRETPPGRQVKIVVWRNGASQTLTATVGSRKNTVFETGPGGDFNFTMPPMNIQPMPPMSIEIPKFQTLMQSMTLGIEGESLAQEPQFAEFLGVKDGVLIKSVTRNSPAEKGGLKAGDVIVKIDDTHVSSSRDITSALRAARPKRTFNITVMRNKKEMPITVTIEERSGGIRAAVPEVIC